MHSFIHAYVHIYLFKSIHAYIHTHIHTYKYTRIQSHLYTNIVTYTQAYIIYTYKITVQNMLHIRNSAPVIWRRTLATVLLCSWDIMLYFDTSHITPISVTHELRGLE